MSKDLKVTPSNSLRPIYPMNGEYYTLEELQHAVNGYVELVDLGENYLVINEEGKICGLAYNRIATDWIVAEGYNDYICGIALLVNKSHIK